jgi:uncharacterized protein
MISCDTNILFYAHNKDCPEFRAARGFMEKFAESEDFALCELVLVELYVLLRNPKLLPQPLSSKEAVHIIQVLRANPCWRIIDYPGDLMDAIWAYAARADVGRYQIYDARIAITLRHHGVTVFATRNVNHFKALGFDNILNPVD